LRGGRICEAKLAVAEGAGVRDLGLDANGWAEDAAGHGAPLVDIATAGGGVERGTRGGVGIELEAGALCVGFSETTGLRIAGKAGAMVIEPDAGSSLKVGSQIWIFIPQRFDAGGKALGVKLVDGEGSVTALRTARAADEHGACTAGGVGESDVDDLHEFAVAGGQGHPGKNTG